MEKQVELFLRLLEGTENTVAFTGAGVSTESGIPDYRSPGTGLWEKMDQSVVSLSGFTKNPENYYSYAMETWPARAAARPNAAHLALARLEKDGRLGGVVTQNVDGLHSEAGSLNVCELHGCARRVACLGCRAVYAMEETMERVRQGENPPSLRGVRRDTQARRRLFRRSASAGAVGEGGRSCRELRPSSGSRLLASRRSR